MRRASQQRGGEEDAPRLPVAVPRGREISGGARVGIDVCGALRVAVEQVLDVRCRELVPPDPPGWSDSGFGGWLDALRASLSDIASVFAERFGLADAEVLSSLVYTPARRGRRSTRAR